MIGVVLALAVLGITVAVEDSSKDKQKQQFWSVAAQAPGPKKG